MKTEEKLARELGFGWDEQRKHIQFPETFWLGDYGKQAEIRNHLEYAFSKLWRKCLELREQRERGGGLSQLTEALCDLAERGDDLPLAEHWQKRAEAAERERDALREKTDNEFHDAAVAYAVQSAALSQAQQALRRIMEQRSCDCNDQGYCTNCIAKAALPSDAPEATKQEKNDYE